MPTRFTSSLASPRMDFFNLGSVLQKQNRHQEAIGLFKHTLTLDPAFTEAHIALADSYSALGLRDAAAEEFRRAGLNPNPPQATSPPDTSTGQNPPQNR